MVGKAPRRDCLMPACLVSYKDKSMQGFRLLKSTITLLLILAFLGLYSYRLTLGVDLTDEAYYAAFPVTWLHTPPSQSWDLSIHQMAGLVTFPSVKLFHYFSPHLDGLILFLRGLYALACLGTAFALFRFLSAGVPPSTALLISLLPVVFMPFGLPAPSYNTIGMLGVTSGLCLFCPLMERISADQGLGIRTFEIIQYIAVPAVLFALAALAYPTMVLLLFSFLSVAIFFVRERKERNVVWLFAIGCFVAVVFTGIVVLWIFGFDRFTRILEFHQRLGLNLGTLNKLRLGWHQMRASPRFVGLCAIGFAISSLAQIVGWPILRVIRLAVVLLGCVLILLLPVPAFFASGHDLVFFVVVSGLPTLLEITRLRNMSSERRIYVILFVTGLLGGSITSWTSANALMNFPIGALVAVLSALVLWTRDMNIDYPVTGRFLQHGFLAGLLACFFYASFHTVYGSYSEETGSQVVCHGSFAGLRTTTQTRDLIDEMTQRLSRLEKGHRTILVLGARSGLGLLTSLEGRTPFSYQIPPQYANGVTPLLENFYRKQENRADLALVFLDQGGQPLNSVESNLLGAHYRLFDRYGSVYFYRRTDDDSSPPDPLPIYLEFDQPVWGEGWSHPEKTTDGKPFIWMAAKEATINFKAQATADVRIEFTVVWAMAPDILDSLGLQVNGHSMQLKSNGRWPTRTLWATVPKEILCESDVLRLAFSVNRTETPPGGNRSLAIAFHDLGLYEASGAQHLSQATVR
jgi:hypothetical protein